MDWVRVQAYFHLTDFTKISALFEILPSSLSVSPTPSAIDLGRLMLPCITKLCITMRLPAFFFAYFDDQPNPTGEEVPPLEKMQAQIWLALPQRLGAHLTSLRRLEIWLDHSNTTYWSAVNERAVLRHFEHLARTPPLEIFLDLPKIHPRLENLLRHVLEEEGAEGCRLGLFSPPMQVRRRLRQHWHVYKNEHGRYVGPTYHSEIT